MLNKALGPYHAKFMQDPYYKRLTALREEHEYDKVLGRNVC
jgi:hypothetical protein